MHERIRSPLHTWHHGSKQERIHGHLLEMREDRRKTEPIYKYMLCPHGCFHPPELSTLPLMPLLFFVFCFVFKDITTCRELDRKR